MVTPMPGLSYPATSMECPGPLFLLLMSRWNYCKVKVMAVGICRLVSRPGFARAASVIRGTFRFPPALAI